MRGRRRSRNERGVSSLELAFIAPSLLVLIFFVVQVAFFLYGRSVALHAAREGVTELRLAQTRAQFDALIGGTKSDVEEFAHHIGSGALNIKNVTATYDQNGNGQVTVTVIGTTVSLIGYTFTVTETASGSIERFGS